MVWCAGQQSSTDPPYSFVELIWQTRALCEALLSEHVICVQNKYCLLSLTLMISEHLFKCIICAGIFHCEVDRESKSLS